MSHAPEDGEGGLGPLDGLLVIDKPSGPTSHDVVARLRRLLAEQRIGHTGTLDPMATGVLPLVLGRATRLARFISAGTKRYHAVIRFGTATDTFDAGGLVTSPVHVGPMPDRTAVDAALDAFRGTFLQTPPAYSAKKIGGVKAYALARRRDPRRPAAVAVTVHRLELIDLGQDVAQLELECSPGFYVRSLAHDLGQRLGVGAHLQALRRTASGGFTVAQAIPLAEAERRPHAARAAVIPLNQMLPDLAALQLTADEANRVAHGRALDSSLFDDAWRPSPTSPANVRLIDASGRLVAVAEFDAASKLLHPSIVLV